MESAAPDRYRVVTWQDPAALHRAAHELTGLELLHRIAGHQLPPPPVADLLGFEPTFVSPGLVVFAYEPREEHYNALGTVHGGIVTTILDTAMSCAVHSELESGVAYATVELKTSFVRPVTLATGPLRAEGRVVHQGSRIATAEAKLLDVAGTLYATSSSTAMILAGRRAKLLAA
ncbi:MAG: PaaI family thioesterase [Gaiellaceae bacterium MAG52_C11]|nr:PaaI family thioesterase [Candidatus Gaiellasilicea maunaloa]